MLAFPDLPNLPTKEVHVIAAPAPEWSPGDGAARFGREQKAGGGSMAWSKSTRIQRPRAWSVTGPYRELGRRLPRCAGSRRRLVALAEVAVPRALFAEIMRRINRLRPELLPA